MQRVDVTVVVGRFQTPHLHIAHKKLLLAAIAGGKEMVMVFIGRSTVNQTTKDPLTVYEREEMITDYMIQHKQEDQKVCIVGLDDVPFSDRIWSGQLDLATRDHIQPLNYQSCQMYLQQI